MEEIRLQKYLAGSGVASRRKAEEYIMQGRVKVNGKVITELGTKIDPEKDEILFDDKKIESNKEFVYILLNKPIGYVTTVKDQFQRDTVMDLLKDIDKRLVPVGRLDMYTSGAILLTNDGEFVNTITHPSHEVEKTYNATLRGIISNDDCDKLRAGVQIDDYITKPAKVKILKIDQEKQLSRIQVTIHEGKNRQVRRMCEAIGKRVLALHRSKIGDIDVKDLRLGTYRHLTQNELKSIYNKK